MPIGSRAVVRALVPVVILASLLAFAPVGSAHAALDTALPAPNGHAAAGLTYVEIRFTEDIERHYTTASVENLKGESQTNGPVAFDDDARNVLRVPVKPLADGIYGVTWRTLSVDTHTASGQYIFSIGNATIKFPETVVAHDHAEHSTAAVAKDGFARAAYYLGLFLALGSPLFALVVDRERDASRRLLLPVGILGVLGAAGAALMLVFLADRTSLDLAGALQTTAGETIAWRGLLLSFSALALLVAAFAPARAARNLMALGVLLAAGSLVATSMGSHAAAVREDRLLAVLADAIHLLMGAVWVGGIFAFVLVGRQREVHEVERLILRFSPLAVASVVLLLATGTYASLRHIPRLSDLWNSQYGRLVAAKIALLLPLIAIGAYNQRVLRPALSRKTGTPKAFRRAVTTEAILMAVILSAAGILAASPPPDSEVEQGDGGISRVFELQQSTATTHVILLVTPNPVTVGVQRIAVQLHSLSVKPLPNSTQVALKVSAPGEHEPETLTTMQKISPNDWTVDDDAYFTREGVWKVHLILQRPDEYKKLVFEVPVGAFQPENQTAG